MKLVRNKEFAIAILDLKHETYIVNPAYFAIFDEIHFFCIAQISLLKVIKAPPIVFQKCSDFAEVFSSKLAVEFPEYTEINNHIIYLLDSR